MDFIFGSSDSELPKDGKKKKQLQVEINLKQQPKKDKELTPLQKIKLQAKKKLKDQGKQSQFDEIQSNQFFNENSMQQASSLDPNVPVSKLLQGQLSVSQKGMKFLDKKLIGDKLSDVENLIYNAESSSQPSNYLKGVYKNIEPDNQFIKGGVDQTINNAMKNVKKQIESPRNQKFRLNVDKKRVPKTKDDLKQLERLDKFRLIKIKQGQVKNKVGDLRNQLEKEYFLNKDNLKFDIADLVDTNYYSYDHPQTRKAQHLITEIQQKRKSEKKRYQQHQIIKQAEKQRIQQVEQEYEQKLKQQRKQKLKQFYQQKFQQRESQREQLKKKQEEFKSWIKMYQRQKPLEEKLAQQMVMKIIIPEIQDRHKKLMKIKAEHKPIDIEQINQHDHRYMDYKKDEFIRHKAHIQMKLEKDSINEEHVSQYYKGKYRYMALESMYEEKNQVDSKDVQRSKKERQLAYSDQVKYHHQSIIKRKSDHMQDTRSLIRRVRNHNGSVSVNQPRSSQTLQVDRHSARRSAQGELQTLDAYAEGLKNLQYVKSHIRRKAMQGQLKKPDIRLVEVRQNNNYLQQIRQQRMQKARTSQDTMKNSSIMSGKGKTSLHQMSTANDLESIKAKVQNLDERIKRKQIKHKHVKGQEMLSLDNNLEDQYVQAINVKLKLVQELK